MVPHLFPETLNQKNILKIRVEMMRIDKKKMWKSGRAGFTLAELIVSAAILGIVVAGILVSYVRCMELNESSKNKSMAIKSARDRMELIKNTPFANIVATYNGVSFNVSGFNGKGISYVTVIDVKTVKVTVSVSWKQSNGRVYGEDKNLNGTLEAGEDKNGDSKLNSPVDISDLIYKRS